MGHTKVIGMRDTFFGSNRCRCSLGARILRIMLHNYLLPAVMWYTLHCVPVGMTELHLLCVERTLALLLLLLLPLCALALRLVLSLETNIVTRL